MMEKVFSSKAAEAHAELMQIMQRIIGESSLDKNEIKFISQSIEALGSHHEAVISEFASALYEELKNAGAIKAQTDEIWKVVTVLAPRDKQRWLESKNFFPVSGLSTLCDAYSEDNEAVEIAALALPMFLDVAYKDMLTYLGRDYTGYYQGKHFVYQLASWSGFCEMEKDLATIARLYGIEKPLIFSPWARRAVRIKLENPEMLTKLSVGDLCLKENGLEDVLLTNHVLMWNIESQTNAKYDSSSFFSDNEHIERIYKNCPANLFIRPLWLNDRSAGSEQLGIKRENNCISMTAPRDKDPGSECASIKIYSAPFYELSKIDAGLLFFSSECDTAGVIRRHPRIRTKGEINQVLSALSNEHFRLEYADANGDPFLPYKKSLGHKLRDSHISDGIKLTPVVNCYFKCSLNSGNEGYANFLADYAIYSTHFLQKCYPEYHWVAVA